jgi:hypothetical protein
MPKNQSKYNSKPKRQIDENYMYKEIITQSTREKKLRLTKPEDIKSIKLTKFPKGIKLHVLNIHDKHYSTKFYNRDKNINSVVNDAYNYALQLTSKDNITITNDIYQNNDKEIIENKLDDLLQDDIAKIVLNQYNKSGIKIDIFYANVKPKYIHFYQKDKTIIDAFDDAIELVNILKCPMSRFKISYNLKIHNNEISKYANKIKSDINICVGDIPKLQGTP